jgi:hypothetical protein
MPILPPIAVLSSCAIWQINNRKPRDLLLSLLVITAMIIYFVFSYFYLYCPQKNCIRAGKRIILTGVSSSSYGSSLIYDSEKIELTKRAVDLITEDYGNRKNYKLGTIMSSGHLGSNEVFYWLYYWNNELYVTDWLESYNSFYKELLSFDYLIFVSYEEDGFVWPEREKFLAMLEKRKAINLNLCKTFEGWNDNFNRLCSSGKEFVLLDTLKFSNGLCWYIYKRKHNN